MGRWVQAELDAQDHDAVEHLVYEGAGHAIGPPHAPPALSAYHPVAQRVYALGGNLRDCARANVDSWPRVIQFLKQALG